MPAPLWTPPVSENTGYVVTATDLDSEIFGNLLFLFNPPSCLLRKTGNYTPSTTGFEVLPFTAGSEVHDVYGMHDAGGANPEQIVIPSGCDGSYLLTAGVVWDSATNGTRALQIEHLNSGTVLAQDDGPSTIGAHQHYHCVGRELLTAGDVIQVRVQTSTNSGSPTVDGALSGDGSVFFAVDWLGSGGS